MATTRQSFLFAASLGAAIALGSHATTAAPVAPLAAEAAAQADTSLIQVASRKKHRHYYRNSVRGGVESDRGWRGRSQGYDNVGSLGQDGYGYGYNRFSGQRYQSCVTDEGYGRTRPCDAGGGGGGGGGRN